MLMILATILVLGICIGLTLFVKKIKSDMQDGITFLFWLVLVSSLVCYPVTWGASYVTYLDDRAFYDATVAQYRDQIKVYKNEAQINVKEVSYTDFKYTGYQTEIANNIRTLTEGVVHYNKSIIKKRILKNNLLFSWLIIAPDDDMVVISLIDKKK